MTNLANRFPYFVGFDRLFTELDSVMENARKLPIYPPFNVRKVDDKTFVIEMAVAGFSKSDIEMTLDGPELKIKGNVKQDPNNAYLFKGIGERAFERNFNISDSLVVKNAEMTNGMLKVWLESLLPERDKPRKIEIGEPSETKQLLNE